MAQALLETVEVETGRNPTASVIWMHGLGADGHDFEPAVPHLADSIGQPVRFVLPHAPMRPVTINAGMRMRAWYDVLGFDRQSGQDETGIRASAAAVGALIQRENERGIVNGRIVLAGFSQGGAMSLYIGARYPAKIAGIVALSCYLPLASNFAAERLAANQSIPIFMAHGSLDAVIEEQRGLEARAGLETAGFEVEWHSYRMAHAVCVEELADISAFLERVLSVGLNH
ncbi:MAG TPA: alpha/beta fold hydrolase [Steroidobacteraceae bacterium]|jgi:phospholipase/carboxylesterase|nr:alpha/beta fold hydrolase [Steroidobacteraceae bacterium]